MGRNLVFLKEPFSKSSCALVIKGIFGLIHDNHLLFVNTKSFCVNYAANRLNCTLHGLKIEEKQTKDMKSKKVLIYNIPSSPIRNKVINYLSHFVCINYLRYFIKTLSLSNFNKKHINYSIFKIVTL